MPSDREQQAGTMQPQQGPNARAGDAQALPAAHALHEYEIGRVLGSGGFGVTYLATDRNLACRVAIKEYLPSDLAIRVDGQAVQPRSDAARESFAWGLARFLDEARALATFHHPHIVRVLRFFEANGTAYMVMDYADGESLHEWIRRHRPVSEAQLMALVHPLLDGLRVVHRSDFLHRDIKPGNVQVRRDGQPVLLDFGSARQHVQRARRDLTTIVTPGYAAFEQYHSQGNQGPWTDLYALGAVMYGIVAGQRPIEAPARVRDDPLPRALDVGDRILYSEALLRAIDWTLEPDERKRPQSVDELLGALPVASPTLASQAPPPPSREQAVPYLDDSTQPPTFDGDSLRLLEQALANHLGPVSRVLVRRTARSVASLDGLRSALAEQVEDEDSRRIFLERTRSVCFADDSRPVRSRELSAPSSRPTSVPPPTLAAPPRAPGAAASQPVTSQPGGGPTAFEPEFLGAVEAELALHLGPLARVLVRKNAARARDRAELFLLLADHIEDPAQRKAFVRKSVIAFREQR